MSCSVSIPKYRLPCSNYNIYLVLLNATFLFKDMISRTTVINNNDGSQVTRDIK